MRIAWLTPYFPAPEDTGGRIRIASLARGFSAPEDERHLYSRRAPDDLANGAGRPGAAVAPWTSIQTWTDGPAPRLVWPSLLPGFARRFPPGLTQALARDHARRPFDAVVVEHCLTGHPLPPLPGAVVVLNEHNVESSYYLRAITAERGRKLATNLRDYVQWRTLERRVWRSVDEISVVSEEDAAHVRRFRPDTTVVTPNGIAIDRYRYIPPSRRAGSAVLFVGLMSYVPNIEAARFLAREVMPRLRRRVPDATLTLAGRDPTAEVRGLASAHVRVTGTVPDIAALFDDHAAFAMPLSFGAGSSLKALEPLATGVPLVASTFAVRGYRLRHGEECLLADGPSDMAEALAGVLTRARDLDPMAQRARRFAEGYAWSSISARFADFVRGAAARRCARERSPGG
jgi:polysaccharide biosynthesis protein PslH